LNEVRAGDYERYLCAALAPPASRAGLIALYAINLELARVRDRVSEPLLGRMRLQWWRDAMKSMGGDDMPPHPALVALAETGLATRLDRRVLDEILDAHERGFDNAPFESGAALERYAARSSGSLARLALSLLGEFGPGVIRAADQIGTAWAMLGQERSLRQRAADHRPALPRDTAVSTVLDRVEEHLTAARTARDAPRGAYPVLMLARLVDVHLRALRRVGGNPFSAGAAPGPLRLQGAIWIGLARRRF
jgi:phytoene synthase